MPSRTIRLKKINNGIHKKSCGFPQLFCVGKRTEEIKYILISQKQESSFFHRLIHRLLITLK